MKKKLLALLLCVLMVVSLLPTMAFAEEGDDYYAPATDFAVGGKYVITTQAMVYDYTGCPTIKTWETGAKFEFLTDTSVADTRLSNGVLSYKVGCNNYRYLVFENDMFTVSSSSTNAATLLNTDGTVCTTLVQDTEYYLVYGAYVFNLSDGLSVEGNYVELDEEDITTVTYAMTSTDTGTGMAAVAIDDLIEGGYIVNPDDAIIWRADDAGSGDIALAPVTESSTNHLCYVSSKLCLYSSGKNNHNWGMDGTKMWDDDNSDCYVILNAAAAEFKGATGTGTPATVVIYELTTVSESKQTIEPKTPTDPEFELNENTGKYEKVFTYGDKDMTVAAKAPGTLSYAVTAGDAVAVDAETGALTVLKAGTATVTITAARVEGTWEQTTLTVDVTVNKKEVTAEVEVASKVYDEKIDNPSLTINIPTGVDYDGDEEDETLIPTGVVGTYDKADIGDRIVTLNLDNLAFDESSTGDKDNYTIKWPDGNQVAAKITEAALPDGVSFSNVTVPFDNNPHSIGVTNTVEATITFKGPGDADFGETNPEFTAVGTYKVYYKVVLQGGDTIVGDDHYATVNITSVTPPSPGPSSPGGGLTTYTITCGEGVKSNREEAAENNTVKLTVADGKSVPTVKDAKGNLIEVTAKGNGVFTFKMPASNVTVSVVCPRDESCPIDEFEDTLNDYWWHDGIHYCLENNLMVGFPGGTFQPNGNVTRAQVVVMLWRVAGKPVVDTGVDYIDVLDDEWYTDAICWADSVGVVTGYDATHFGPDNSVTREQLSAMLYRYAQTLDLGFTGTWMFLLDFEDRADIAAYAYESVCWTTMKAVVNGVDGAFQPGRTATRAETAAMFQRLCQNVLGK